MPYHQAPVPSPGSVDAVPCSVEPPTGLPSGELATAGLAADDVPTVPMIRLVRRPDLPRLVR
jgi:hypothetical protein